MNEEYSFENFQKRREEIKNKHKTSKRKLSKLFLNTFLLFLLMFLVIGILISPRLNIPATSDNNTTETQDTGARIDSRLHDIQAADNAPLQANEASKKLSFGLDLFHKSSNDENTLPVFDAPQLPSQNYIRTQMPSSKEQPQKTEIEKAQEIQLPTAPATPAKTYRILVGDYMLEDDAKSIQDLLATANVKPAIKTYNGNYVLQVGAFSDYTKAQKVATQYKAKNYKVRIVED